MSRRFPRSVVLLSWANFFNDVASELLLKGALPVFLVEVLGAPLVAVGFIDGAAEALATVIQLVSGWWADRLGRCKPFVLGGYALSNFTKPLLYLAGTWPQALAIRLVDRAGKGLRAATCDAMIAAATPAEERGAAFGLNHAMDSAGAVTSLLAGALIIRLCQDPAAPLAAATFRKLVLFIVLPGLLTLVFTKLAREEHRPPRVYRPLDAAGLGPRFWRLLAVFFLFSLGNSTDSFLILRARNLNMSLSSIFVLLAGFNLVNVLFSFYSGALSDRFGRKRFLTAGWVLYALVYAGFGHARSAGQVIPLLLLYGAYYGLTEGVGKALVADIVSVERRATAYGVLGAAQGFSVLPAGVLAGWLWGAVSPAAPFWAGSALSLLAAAALAVGV